MTDQCPGPAQHGHPDVYESHCIHGETTPHNIIVTIERLRIKLAKARAALIDGVRLTSFLKCDMDCRDDLLLSDGEHYEDCLVSQAHKLAQTLKEIDE